MWNYTLQVLSNTVLRGHNLLLIILALFFIMLFALMAFNRDKLRCVDLVTDNSGKLSLEAIGQLCGVLVAMWSPVYTATQGHIDASVLAISLGYLGAIHSYSKYLQSKNGGKENVS